MITDREWIFAELKRALLALSLPGCEALATVAGVSAKSDELALDFGHFLETALGNFGSEFTDGQRVALKQIDDLLDRMSGAHQAELWSDEAVIAHPKWQEVRALAHEARRLLGWDTE